MKFKNERLLGKEIEKHEILDCNLKNRNTVCAYVDGSYKSDIKIYGFGVVMCVGDMTFEQNGYGDNWKLSKLRNVTGELLASMYAIEWAIKNKFKKIIIYYDYTGICEWALERWKPKKVETEEYRDFIRENSEKIEIEFIKVMAHSGDIKNDIADRLAKEATGVIMPQ